MNGQIVAPAPGLSPAAAAPPPRWPWWGIVLAVTAGLSVLALLAVTVTIALSVGTMRTVTGHRTITDAAAVAVSGSVGQLSVIGEPGRRDVEVQWRVRASLVEPEVLVADDDGTVRVSADCADDVVVGPCWADVVLRVPPATAVAVDVEFAEVTITDMAGQLDVDVDVGNIRLTDVAAPRATVVAELGQVDVTCTVAPESLDVRVDVGDVQVLLPVGDTVYDVTASSDVGEAAVTVPTGSGSAHVVTAVADLGQVLVTRPGDPYPWDGQDGATITPTAAVTPATLVAPTAPPAPAPSPAPTG